jgi:fumarate reductase subunit C
MAHKITNANIEEFLEDVKAQLSDLSSRELEGLIDGLADELQEQRDNDPTFRLANAKVYANELRSAAGLPAQTRNENSNAFLKFVSWTWKFLKTFQTTWFAFRGYLLYPFVFSPIVFHQVVFFPRVWMTIGITIGFIALSLWVGNGRGKLRFLKYPLIVINLLAAVASTFVAAQVQVSASEYVEYKTIHDGGKLFRGSQWVNYICAFDAQGKQLKFSRLTDRLGDTIYTYEAIEPFSKDCKDEY